MRKLITHVASYLGGAGLVGGLWLTIESNADNGGAIFVGVMLVTITFILSMAFLISYIAEHWND